MIYSPQMTLGEARRLYFRLNAFGEDGGYRQRWIKVKVWKIPIWLPNTNGRQRAVMLHDLHHVLTEYPTTWRGEAEISAWEIGAGGLRCYYAGWILDLMTIAQGLVVNPVGVYRGFMRGRSTSNLYSTGFSDELLHHKVGEYRDLLGLDKSQRPPSTTDHLLLAFWILVSAGMYFAAVLVSLLPLILIGLWVFSPL
jgi:hypothetical protein